MSADVNQAPQQFERVDDGSMTGVLSDMQAEFQDGNNQIGDIAGEQTAVVAVPEPTPLETEKVAAPPADSVAAATTPPEPEAPPPSPESRLAPIYALASLPFDQAMPQAVEVMRDNYAHDPVTYQLFAAAVLQASPKDATAMVLKQAGIAPERITQFNDWIAKGGDALPEPVTYPAFDSLVQKLESNDDNEWVKLNGMELNLADPRDKAHLELERRLYEGDVRDKVQAREEAVARRQEEDRQELNRLIETETLKNERATFYETGRYGIIDETVDKIVASLAPDDSLRGKMLKAYAHDMIDNHPEIIALGRQASTYVQQGHGFEKGVDGKWAMKGRIAEFADAQDRIIRREMNALKDAFNKDVLRVNQAELAATSTQPVIPPTAQPITSVVPAPQGLETAQTFDEILAAARAADRQMAASRRQ